MRFASAAYGAALMIFFGLVKNPPAEKLTLAEQEFELECICEHTGVAPLWC